MHIDANSRAQESRVSEFMRTEMRMRIPLPLFRRLPHGIDDPFGVELASVSVLRQGEGWQLDVLGLLP